MMLLKLFKELSLHPKNAAELKALILQLAVQGKLTAKWREENPDVEPASELLKRVDDENTKIDNWKQPKFKKDKSNSVAPPFSLPDNWEWRKLSDISNINGGFAFKSSNYSEEGIRVIRISDFDEMGFKNERIVRYKYSNDFEAFKLEENNILIAMTGGTVGKSLFVKKLPENMVVNQRVATIRIIKPLNEAYINCVIKTPLVQDKINEAKNSTNDNISMVDIKGFWMPLPPLKEQHAIVTTVNQLFAEVEQLEQLTKECIQLKHDFAASALQRLVQAGNINGEWAAVQQHFHTFFNEKPNVKKLRKTILQLAVQGKLTTHWRRENPDTEPATELLKRISDEKQQLINEKAFQKPREPGDIAISEFDIELPVNWSIAKVVDLCFVTKLAGFEYTKYINLQNEGEIPVIRAQNVKMNRIDERNLKYIDSKTSQMLNRCALNKPSILMTFIGAGIGDVALFDKNERWHLAPNVAKLEPFNQYAVKLNPQYLLIFFMSPIGQFQIFKHSKATAQPSLSMSTIRDAIVCLPPIKEQHAIVTTVNSLMTLCDALEQELGQQESRVEELMRSCLREVVEY